MMEEPGGRRNEWNGMDTEVVLRSMSEWRTFISGSGNYGSGTIYRSQGRIGGNIVLTKMSGIDRNSHFVSIFSSPLDFTSASKVSESVAKIPNGFMPSRTARARMLCDFTNTDEEATARRALNGVHGAAAAIHKLSLFLWSSLNAAAAAGCLSFSVIDARWKLVERG